MRVSKAAVTAAALLAVAGCGSTLQSTGGSAPSGLDALGTTPGATGGTAPAVGDDGLSVPGGESAAGTASRGSTGAGSAAGSTSGGGSTTGATGSSGAPAGTGGAAPAALGPGVTTTSINIGLPVTDNSRAAAAALGASGTGVGGGDGQAQFDILVHDINQHGGVLGRKLVPIYHHYDATSTEPLDQQENEACADWTQDHKVFAVANGDSSSNYTLTSCIQKAGAVQVYDGFTQSDFSTYQRFPSYVEVGSLNQDRMAAVWPAQLSRQGYFGGWNYVNGSPSKTQPVRVGVISFDDASSVRAVDDYLEPALARSGYKAYDYRSVLTPKGEADNGTSISQIQNVVLRFRSEQITHVLAVESSGAGIGGFFARGASAQHYYPRFGLTSGNGAQVLVGAGVWPRNELNGAMGFGWVPLVDVTAADDPTNGPYSNGERKACIALMRKHGQTINDPITERQAVEHCDEIHFLVRAIELGGVPNRDAFLRGVALLKGSFVAGDTFRTTFSPSRHDGVSVGRPMSYLPSCHCVRYTGSAFTIP